MKNYLACATVLIVMLLPSPGRALGWFGTTLNGAPCDGNSQGFGPYDYFEVDEPTDPLYQIGMWWEASKIHGEPGFAAMNANPFDQSEYNRAAVEFDYLLRGYPNHPDILRAVIALELKRRKSEGIRPYQTPPECYLQRAMAFKSGEPHVHQLLALYLQQLGRLDEALAEYQRALELAPGSAEVRYNIGLVFLAKKELGKALQYAQEAYELGFPLPGLRRRLQEAGAWKEAALAVEEGSAHP